MIVRKTMTVDELAEELGISRTLAYILIRQGQIPSIRLGRRIVILRTALDSWLEAQSAGGAA